MEDLFHVWPVAYPGETLEEKQGFVTRVYFAGGSFYSAGKTSDGRDKFTKHICDAAFFENYEYRLSHEAFADTLIGSVASTVAVTRTVSDIITISIEEFFTWT